MAIPPVSVFAWPGRLLVLVLLVAGCTGAGEDRSVTDVDPADQAARPGAGDATPEEAQPSSPPRTETPRVDDPWHAPGDPLRGMAVLAYTGDDPPQMVRKAAPLLDRLVHLGVNVVSLNVPVYQADATATEVSPGPATPPGPSIRAFVAEADRRGLAVMLRPILDEESLVGSGDWRGSIRPSDVGDWFDSYGTLLEGFARLAGETDTEILSIGAELSSLEGHVERWRSIAQRVREDYGGLLIYSTNWDRSGRGPVGFADSLDLLGIDAFFPLDVGRGAGVDELAAAWRTVVDDLERSGWDLDETVFTEAGVTAQVGAPTRPYVWDHGTDVDEQVRARYYTAGCDVLRPRLGGLFWWAADLNHPAGTPDTPTFDPLGTPAEAEVRECFGGVAGPDGRAAKAASR